MEARDTLKGEYSRGGSAGSLGAWVQDSSVVRSTWNPFEEIASSSYTPGLAKLTELKSANTIILFCHVAFRFRIMRLTPCLQLVLGPRDSMDSASRPVLQLPDVPSLVRKVC